MISFKKKYYNQKNHWKQDFYNLPSEKHRIEETCNYFPKEIDSILDAGCGNGALLNYLNMNGKFNELVGLDFSFEGLKFVQTNKILGEIYELPLKNKSFELVISTEVVEHLNFVEFEKTLNEYKRVSKKYILITVPNDEDLETSLVICNNCKCKYNPFFHLQSFDFKNVRNIFEKYLNVKIIVDIGPYEYKYRPNYLKLRHFLKPQYANSSSICPQCGFQSKKNNSNAKSSKTSIVKKIEKLLFGKKRKKWLLVLLAHE